MDSDLLYQGRGGGIWAEMWFVLVSSWGSKVGGVGGWDEGGMFRWNIAFRNRNFALLAILGPTPPKPC